jgi:hypothetical protein
MGLWVDYLGRPIGRLRINAWASVAIVATAMMSRPVYAAVGLGVCGTIRLPETAVAMLSNQPIVKVFADNAAVLLLLDTGSEATVLTPAPRSGSARSTPASDWEDRCTGSPATFRPANWSCGT